MKMTQVEGERPQILWALIVILLFVLFGGFVGGAAIPLAMSLFTLAAGFQTPDDAQMLLQIPLFATFTGLYGILFGLPAAALTGLAYVARPARRHRWLLTAFGAASSAAWGVLLMSLLASSPAPFDTFASLAATFAACGAVATLSSFSLLKALSLHHPI